MKRFFSDNKIILVVSVFLTTILAIGGTKAVDFGLASIANNLNHTNQKCPVGMVLVSSEKGDFCIDKYENSPGPNCQFKNPKNQEETRIDILNPRCSPVSIKGVFPWTNISQTQAALACAKAGKRLPTNKEWYLAALGTPDINSNFRTEDCQLNKNWLRQPGLTGSGKNCVSSAGAYDMAGNVWEWVGGAVVNGKYKGESLPSSGFIQGINDETGLPFQTNPEQANLNYNKDYFWILKKGTRAIVRGGYWESKSDGGIYSAYLMALPSNESPGTGFRCVSKINKK